MAQNDSRRSLKVSSRLDEVESFHNEYIKEINSLSKIFITLSIAIIGFTLSFIGPELNKRVAVNWVIFNWFFSWITLIIGIFCIYLYSKMFKAKADYLHDSVMYDVADDFKASNEIINGFRQNANEAYKKYERCRCCIIRLIYAQALSLSFSLICLTVFVFKNFILKDPVP